jgi:hypothetical protein
MIVHALVGILAIFHKVHGTKSYASQDHQDGNILDVFDQFWHGR